MDNDLDDVRAAVEVAAVVDNVYHDHDPTDPEEAAEVAAAGMLPVVDIFDCV